MTEWWLILFWFLFGLLHSLMAVSKFKRFAIGTGIAQNIYRIFYNLISGLTLYPIVRYHFNYSGARIFDPTIYITAGAGLIAISAFLILYSAFRNYDLSEFLGFRKSAIEEKLNISGINSVVRHPLYTATIIGTIGLWLFQPDAAMTISAFCIFIYLIIGTYFEESKLIQKFGDTYRAYKKSVPRFFPKPRDFYKLIFR